MLPISKHTATKMQNSITVTKLAHIIIQFYFICALFVKHINPKSIITTFRI